MAPLSTEPDSTLAGLPSGKPGSTRVLVPSSHPAHDCGLSGGHPGSWPWAGTSLQVPQALVLKKGIHRSDLSPSHVGLPCPGVSNCSLAMWEILAFLFGQPSRLQPTQALGFQGGHCLWG